MRYGGPDDQGNRKEPDVGEYPNSGILSRNDRRKSDNHPEFTGTAEVDGVEYWLSAWVNETREGRKYFKIRFKKKDDD